MITTLELVLTRLFPDSSDDVCVEDIWALCKHIAKTFTVSNLHLSIHCDMSGNNTNNRRAFLGACQILQGLKHCALLFDYGQDNSQMNIDQNWDCVLNKTKEALVRRARSMQSKLPPTSSAFPFFRLPAEVRETVLEYAGLVSCYPDRPWYDGWYLFENGVVCRQSGCCGTCTLAPFACYCREDLVAFSTSCTCAPNPAYLFNVSKAMRKEARRVFVTRNVFAVQSPTLIGLDQTLSVHPKELLHGIRHLRVHCTELFPAGMDRRMDSVWCWASVASIIKHYFYIPTLNLSIECCDGVQGPRPAFLGATNLVKKRVNYLYEGLKELEGLRSLKLYLPSEDVYCSPNSSDEDMCEKMVMGPEYDGSKFGKLAYGKRVWCCPWVRRDQVPEYLETAFSKA